ncbi:MAG: methionine--tRNA ligase subunit beta, partial [Vicinamibacterales bacterium]
EGAAAEIRLVSAANNYIAETQPWALAKDPANADRLNGVLADTAEAVRIAAVLLSPVMPSSATEILRRLGDSTPAAARRLDQDTAWRSSGEKQVLNAGALWPRIEADKGVVTVTDETPKAPEAAAPVAPLAPAPPPAPQAPEAPQAPSLITIDDFMKIHLKVAKVLEAERMPKSQKLLKLKVDAGEAEPRTILAGIAESYEPEAMVGKTIVIVANLAPRKMMGLESNGMVLAASPDGGAAIVLNVEPATPGTRVR